MIGLIARRMLAAVPTLLVVMVATFALTRAAPGGPFDLERGLDPAIKAHLVRLYGLDLPLPEQFVRYVWSLMRGDFGPSLHWRDFSVNALIARALPISAALGGAALALALVCGLALGVLAAERGRLARPAAAFVALLTLVGLAVPTFVVVPVLQLVFGLLLHVLPVGGWTDEGWRVAVLPVAALALPQTAVIARLVQVAQAETLAKPHIRTLQAFGLPRGHVRMRALRGALLPLVSYLGPAAVGLLTGSVVVETIFGIPGLGRYFVDGALARDYTLVMATVVVVAVATLAFNLLADLLYGALDPRIRHG